MGVILADIERDDVDCQVNWWNWRPTLTVLEQSGIFDKERLDRMSFTGGGVTVTASEAVRIADFLEQQILPAVDDGYEVKLNGKISNEPTWLGPIKDAPADRSKLYGASKEWLREFAAFCRTCRGFHVY
jgi:hypothetical protein